MLTTTFFGNEGLTLTSANHIANLAKEFAKSNERALSSASFVDTNMTIIGSDVNQCIHKGWSDEQLKLVEGNLCAVSDSHALIAWLREAIKAHKSLVDSIEKRTVEDYCSEQGIELPEEPIRERSITEEEYIETLSIKDRNRMLMLQAKASVYGKFIHPDGPFSKARAELMEKMVNETEVKENGRDTLIYSFVPTADAMGVEKVFYQLQKEYRETQAELNGYLHKVSQAVQKDADEKAKAYHDAMVLYRSQVAQITKEFENLRMEALDEARLLRIVIPNELKGIYSIISELGK